MIDDALILLGLHLFHRANHDVQVVPQLKSLQRQPHQPGSGCQSFQWNPRGQRSPCRSYPLRAIINGAHLLSQAALRALRTGRTSSSTSGRPNSVPPHPLARVNGQMPNATGLLWTAVKLGEIHCLAKYTESSVIDGGTSWLRRGVKCLTYWKPCSGPGRPTLFVAGSPRAKECKELSCVACKIKVVQNRISITTQHMHHHGFLRLTSRRPPKAQVTPSITPSPSHRVHTTPKQCQGPRALWQAVGFRVACRREFMADVHPIFALSSSDVASRP